MTERDANQLAAPEVQAVRDMVWALRLELPAEVWSDVERRVEAVVARITDLEADQRRWLAWSGGDYPDDSPGDVIRYETDGTIFLDDGITTWNPLRALAAAEAQVAALTQERDGSRAEVLSRGHQIVALNIELAEAGVAQRAAEAALATTRQALAAYRSALRSGEPETDELRALADTDSDTAGRCPGNLPASSCCGAPDGECIHP